MKHFQPQVLALVAEQGEAIAPADPRAEFYRAVGWILQKDKPDDCERLLRDYLRRAPLRSTFPPPWRVHEWLGRLYENQQKTPAAIQEYEASLKLEPKNKNAREALKRLKNG
jgi:TolA-binding protein